MIDLKEFHDSLGALIARNEELEAVQTPDPNIAEIELRSSNLESVIKILRVKAQALADAVAPGKAPKEIAKWEAERKALMDAIKISREAVP